jgi:predicted Zn-dependent protease
MFRSLWILFFVVASAGLAHAQKLDPLNPPVNATEREAKVGEEASKEFEAAKSTKLLDPKSSDEAKALYAKLNGMAEKFGAASKRSGIKYIVKVVEGKEVNAFTLPDGKIYVFRGLLDFCANDDEIAAVIAHEIGHNTRMHALRGEAKAKKLNWVNLAAIAAMLAGGESGVNVGQFSQYLLIGVMNGHGIEYEKEADSEAIEMMKAVGYNPSALVTFMSRLKRQEGDMAGARLGIFQTHPSSAERADAALDQIKREGLEFNPRAVTGGKEAVATEKPDRWSITLGDTKLLDFAKSTDESAAKRAKETATKINTLLKANLALHELNANTKGQLLARGQVLATASKEDAKLDSLTPEATVKKWYANFQNLFWREKVSGKF